MPGYLVPAQQTLNAFTPTGNISSTTVADAIIELDNEKPQTSYVQSNFEKSIPLQSSAPTSPASSDLWVDNTITAAPELKVYTGSTWTSVTPQINLSAYAGHISPSATNTYDLGSSSFRWRNIYTQDLNLSNGIGDYTVVEGEENLYLVNNKNGKSFKFALIEVDPSEVPPKSES